MLNGSLGGHPLLQDEFADFVTAWAVPLFAAAAFGLWFLDRPGPPAKWRLACLSGLAAAGLGLLLAQPIGWVWFRERPYDAHPGETLLLVPASNEPSFPSDHAVAAFAIAFAVAMFGRRMGALFLAGATMVALARVFVGLHYPGDIAGGMLIGLAAAVVVRAVPRRMLLPLVRVVSRFTDPVATMLWRAFDRAAARLYPRR